MRGTPLTPEHFKMIVKSRLHKSFWSPEFSDDKPGEFTLQPGDTLATHIGKGWNLVFREDGTAIPADNPGAQLSLGNIVIASVEELEEFLEMFKSL